MSGTAAIQKKFYGICYDVNGNYICNIKFHIPEKNFHRFIYKLTLIMYICGHRQMMLFLI
jgi:hypothetical protein